jgi:hypothetical protein
VLDLARGPWFTNSAISPRAFGALARRHWETTLRQRASGRELEDAIDSHHRSILFAERQRQDRQDYLKGTAAVWDAALARLGIDGVTQGARMGWVDDTPSPVRQLLVTQVDPTEENEYSRTNGRPWPNNHHGAFTPFPIVRTSFDWELRRISEFGVGGIILPPRTIPVTPELDRFYSVLFDWSWIRARYRDRVLAGECRYLRDFDRWTPEWCDPPASRGEYRYLVDILDPTPGPRSECPTGQIHRTARWSEEATPTFHGYWIGKTALFRYRRNYNRPIGLRHVKPFTNVTTPFRALTGGFKGPLVPMPEGQEPVARASLFNARMMNRSLYAEPHPAATALTKRNKMVENMEQDFSEAKDYRQAKTCPRCQTVFYKAPCATIHCASECPKLGEVMIDGKLERVA